MKNYVLMPLNEPTDKQLIVLMKEVALEAKLKALSSKKKLAEQVSIEIGKAEAKYKLLKKLSETERDEGDVGYTGK